MSAAAHALPSRELVLDRYRPLRPLGSGGSGSVWLARDEQTGLDVALKIVPREGKAAARAEREAEAAARLRHERCLRAYGFGSDYGHVYIAYEYVGGRTLREAMRAGELRDGQAVEAAAQILDGLAHAHSRGIVHRDVKPSNVLLAEGEGISVRLLDFGLAQFDEAETLTAVGDVPGTLAYISPERLCGEEACAASDVWGVGVLLWEALAGKHPFWGVPLLEMAGTIEAGAPPLASRAARTCRSACSPRSGTRWRSTRPGGRPRPRWRRSCAPRSRARRRSTKLEQCCRSTNSQPAASLPAAATGLAAGVGAATLPFYPLGRRRRTRGRGRSRCVPRRRAPASRSRSRCRSSRSGTSRSASRSSTAAVALAWLALSWRDARFGLAFLAGPLLAPFGLLALVPARARREPRRCATRGAGARRGRGRRRSPPACAAGSSRSAKEPRHALDLAGRRQRRRRRRGARGGGPARPRPRGASRSPRSPSHSRMPARPWRIAGLGAGALAATLLAAPAAPALPLVAAAWLTCAVCGSAARTVAERALDSFAGGT